MAHWTMLFCASVHNSKYTFILCTSVFLGKLWVVDFEILYVFLFLCDVPTTQLTSESLKCFKIEIIL
jgi:hypothetical protein